MPFKRTTDQERQNASRSLFKDTKQVRSRRELSITARDMRIKEKRDADTKRKNWRISAVRSCPYCDYCNCVLTEDSSTVDHIISLREGGIDRPRNFAIACHRCNSFKSHHYLCDSGLLLLRRRSKNGSPKQDKQDRAGLLVDDRVIESNLRILKSQVPLVPNTIQLKDKLETHNDKAVNP